MTSPQPVTELEIRLPRKLGFLLEMHPYKIAYGGRDGMKTKSFANAILSLGANQKLRILCCREIMRSIRDSVHKELSDQIEARGLGKFYTVLETEIRGRNGTEIIFTGLAGHTVESVKSFANIDIVWVEEAQTVVKRSWDILLPSIKAPNSEIWVSFNPEMDTDDTWKRWVEHPPEGAIVVKMGWQDTEKCGWLTKESIEKRLHCRKHQPDDYDNIWEGKPRTVVAGAIYTREIITMIEEGRSRPVPYDPRLPVDTIWDLGWNDAMSIIMVQKQTPTTINIVNYREDSGRRYDEYVADLERLPYRWGFDWLPHDATHHHPTSGTNAKKQLEGLGRKIKLIPRSDPESRIKAARMMFPRVIIDNTERKCETGVLGGAHLIDRLKRYKRNVPTTTGEPSTPTHDAASHGADAFGGLAEIVEQIRGEFVKPIPSIEGFKNSDSSMGMLG